MLKFVIVLLFINCLSPGAIAAEQDSTAARTLLQKITEFKIFRLRLPAQIQRSIPTPQTQVSEKSEDSCSSQPQARQKGGELTYTCHTQKVLKTEFSAVATN